MPILKHLDSFKLLSLALLSCLLWMDILTSVKTWKAKQTFWEVLPLLRESKDLTLKLQNRGSMKFIWIMYIIYFSHFATFYFFCFLRWLKDFSPLSMPDQNQEMDSLVPLKFELISHLCQINHGWHDLITLCPFKWLKGDLTPNGSAIVKALKLLLCQLLIV